MAGSTRVPAGGKTTVVVVVVMLVTTMLAWGLYVHNPAPSDPERPAFLSAPNEPLPPPSDSEAFQATATLRSNYPHVDQTNVVRTKVYYPDEPAIVKDTQLASGYGPVLQQTTFRQGDQGYIRATYNDRAAFDERIDAETVVRVDQTSLTFYEVEQSATVSPGIEPRHALRSLYLLRFEERGHTTYDGHDAIRYEAVNGWTTSEAFDEGDTAKSIYVRQARGEVIVDAQTGAILKADVTGSFIEATNWADVMTHPSYSLTITYDVDTTVEPPSQPPWVDSLKKSNQTVTQNSLSPPA